MRVLISAFEPYGEWDQNASWDVLVEYLREYRTHPSVVTRRYPVSLHPMAEKLHADLAQGYDVVLHLGQAPGSSQIQLETIALNVAGMTRDAADHFGELLEGAPVAYRTELPMGIWAAELRKHGIPTRVSYHAGTYLCNAAMFLSLHWYQQRTRSAPVGFVHFPLTHEQSLTAGRALPSLSTKEMAWALKYIVDQVIKTEFALS